MEAESAGGGISAIVDDWEDASGVAVPLLVESCATGDAAGGVEDAAGDVCISTSVASM